MSKQSMWRLGIGFLLGVAAFPVITRYFPGVGVYLFFISCGLGLFGKGDCW